LLTRVSRLAFVIAHRARAQQPARRGLTLLARLQRERGVRVVVALLPAFSQPFESHPHMALHERMRASAARLPTLT
jgi:hypothetical protein